MKIIATPYTLDPFEVELKHEGLEDEEIKNFKGISSYNLFLHHQSA